MREFQQLSQSGSRSSQPSSSGKYGPITAIAEDLPDGVTRVGKITFTPDQLLGKGCDGTFVYRYKPHYNIKILNIVHFLMIRSVLKFTR